jgi:uncharacterized protein YacL
MRLEMWGFRVLFVLGLSVITYHLRPFHWQPPYAAALGAVIGVVCVVFEMRLEKVSLKRLIGAGLGATLGILAALMIGHLLSLTSVERHSTSFFQVTLLLMMAYIGMALGAIKGDVLNLAALGGLFAGERPRRTAKILDTSVIIDGRICDVCEAGFIEGAVMLPQFVLRELQLVADSSDALKRNRGRRGLDMLQRIQKMSTVQVQIVEDDFPQVRTVDLKLIELAKVYDGKIITNDFNLNKVAQLQGIAVLNLNELANALRPAVLPGETMRVYILKEGKEYNQGVAYLDDGTMVVVDNAKKMLSKTIDISVTSVLQTTAGRMIFGRYDERTRAAEVAHSTQ